MNIHWLADALWVIAGINVLAVIWALFMWRNTPKPPHEQYEDDLAQQREIARWKKAA